MPKLTSVASTQKTYRQDQGRVVGEQIFENSRNFRKMSKTVDSARVIHSNACSFANEHSCSARNSVAHTLPHTHTHTHTTHNTHSGHGGATCLQFKTAARCHSAAILKLSKLRRCELRDHGDDTLHTQHTHTLNTHTQQTHTTHTTQHKTTHTDSTYSTLIVHRNLSRSRNC